MHLKDTDRIIEMAWEDKTPFEAIKNTILFFRGSCYQSYARRVKT